MESAFLFQHFTEYNVNAGQNLSSKVRRSNSAWESVRNKPSLVEIDESENNEMIRSTIPKSFPLLDILDGIRGDRGPKGPLECNSEELLRFATTGDCIAVSSLLQSACVHVDVADKTGYTPLLAAAVSSQTGTLAYRSILSVIKKISSARSIAGRSNASAKRKCKHKRKRNT
jgi:hypothetical protein